LTSLGCSKAGIVFNICLLAITMILFVLGAGLSFELAPLKKPVYWGISVMAVIAFIYSVMFLFIPDALLSGYHVTFDDMMARALFLALMKYGFSGLCFQMSVWLLAAMMTTDFMHIYALNRYIATIQFGLFLAVVTNVAWWNTKNVDGHLDSFILGQWMGGCMWFIYFLLTYVPVILLDTQIARSVEEALGGVTELHSPTLLSGDNQQKKVPLLAGKRGGKS